MYLTKHYASLSPCIFFNTDIFTSVNYFIGKEDYEEVQTCLGTVFSEIDDLPNNGIEVDGVHYSVIW